MVLARYKDMRIIKEPGRNNWLLNRIAIMEKIIVFLLFVVVAVSGCGTRYCNVQDTAHSFDVLFIQQFSNGVARTSDNWQGLQNYVKNDVGTAWPRLSGTAVELYQRASFSGTGDRMAGFWAMLAKQFNEGIDDSWNNLQWIAKFLCLYKGCGLDDYQATGEGNYIAPPPPDANYLEVSPPPTNYIQPQPQIEPTTLPQNEIQPQPHIEYLQPQPQTGQSPSQQ